VRVHVLNYGATNVAPTQKDQPLLLSKRRPHFHTYKWSWNDKKFVHESRRGPKPRITELARLAVSRQPARTGAAEQEAVDNPHY
jgi:hypothetical protein